MKKAILIILHILFWALFLFFDLVTIWSSEHIIYKFKILQSISHPLMALVSFYFYYLYLCPIVLAQKKVLNYILISAGAATLFSVLAFGINKLITGFSGGALFTSQTAVGIGLIAVLFVLFGQLGTISRGFVEWYGSNKGKREEGFRGAVLS